MTYNINDPKFKDWTRFATDEAIAVPKMATVHKVKSWPQFFQFIKSGLKTHDLRRNDRDYKVGDLILLQEFDPKEGVYTGEEVTVEITFITSNTFPCAYSSAYLDRDAVILSLSLVENA